MNLDMFSNIDGLVLRDNSVPYADRAENNTMPDSMVTMPAQTPLAMAYVPYQQWGDVREPEEALKCGTLFTDLSFPFERGGSDK